MPTLSMLYAQGRKKKLAAGAICGPRAGQGKKGPSLPNYLKGNEEENEDFKRDK